jgi:hypothetical protein
MDRGTASVQVKLADVPVRVIVEVDGTAEALAENVISCGGPVDVNTTDVGDAVTPSGSPLT